MSLPKEPRQKMINMMYLVLTALLALNVSSEILNAFKTVNSSLLNANGIIDAKNQGIFTSFDRKVADPKTAEKARIWREKANQAKVLADDMSTYIEGLKGDLMKEAGQKVAGGEFREDNLDAATRMLVEGPKGKELNQRLEKYRNDLLAIDPEIKAGFANSLPIDLSIPKSTNEGNKGWEAAYFRMTPTIAAITMLSKFQNDVKNSEAQVVDFCHRKVGEVEVVYNEFQAFAGTNSQYLMPGQELVITAGVGAFSKAAKPNISIDGAGVGLNTEGVAEYKTKVGGPGTYTKNVNISFIKPDGTTSTISKKVEYTVGSPTGASVSADAVKVLYIGLPNPLTITGGTAGAEKTSARIDNGNLTAQGGGKYIATVSSPGKATISVTVEGKTTPFEFRVKRVPDPVAMIGASTGGRIPANSLKAQQGVRADLKDFVFEGVKFDIVGFTLYATGANFLEAPGISQNAGAYFNAESKRILERSRPGSTIVIDEIRARGPGGDTRQLPTMAFNLY
ncbi:gliding motility protein GldM [Segetibacter sp. 3557_3]|uniref:type IX secretion system motor protein PorM/GldM n=1 Tax=Segetibacter sp. 3557_3 TaxID=2547429 RepID=UPI0010584BDC|nr:gliding motility protein GldM [Segetibacter sp. 3557_3]TDH19790.1 gliding motility protein GldM [Segetibacter sp. 3557_3]